MSLIYHLLISSTAKYLLIVYCVLGWISEGQSGHPHRRHSPGVMGAREIFCFVFFKKKIAYFHKTTGFS